MKTIKHFLLLSSVLTLLISCGGGGGNGGSGNDGEPSAKLADVCPVIIDLLPGMNIKYKSENLHGGRGPSWLMGCQSNSRQFWPPNNYLQPIPIYSIKGNEIGRFIVFEHRRRPYGTRAYSGLPGGYPPDSSTLTNSALADGSTNIFVNPDGTACFKVETPLESQGTIGGLFDPGPC